MFSKKACTTCQKNTWFKILVTIMVLSVITVLTGAVNDSDRKTVTLKVYDAFSGVDMIREEVTFEETVEGFLNEINYIPDQYDKLSLSLDTPVEDGTILIIRKGKSFKVETKGEVIELSTTKKKVGEALAQANFYLGEHDIVTPSRDENLKDLVKVIRVDHVVKTQTESIPFTEKITYDDSLYNDEKIIKVAGVNGAKEVNYTSVYHDGVFVATNKSSETVTKSPVVQESVVGTKKRVLTHKGFTYKKKLTVTATAYDPYPPGGSGLGITANGMKAQYGVVAVDPRVIPLGTKLYIESTDDGKSWTYGYCIAADTGGAIKGNKIDLCYNTVAECIQFGRRKANVYVLN